MASRIPKVVVIGPTYVDMAIKCRTFPQPGQTVDGSSFSCVITGPGPNQAVEAALCGCEAHLISKVGDDPFGEVAKQHLTERNVNIEFVYTAQAMSTGIIVTMVDSIGENSSCVSAGANRALSSDEVACAAAEQLIGSADVCLIHGELPRDVIVSAIRIASLYKTKVILVPKMTIDEPGDLDNLNWPMEFYSVEALVPDLQKSPLTVEIGAGNIHRIKLIGSELVARGIHCVIIRMGLRGSLFVDRQGTTRIPGFNIEVVDQTGCADAFTGALAACCAVGDEPVKAIRFAAAACALARTKFGAQDALPTKQEIIQLLQQQPD